jgi:hypothetical protein
MSISHRLVVLFFSLFAMTAYADLATKNIENAYAHQKLSRGFVEAKQWEKARDEAKLATTSAPDSQVNRDAWLLLGATEERLGNLQAASEAYSKYLTLMPLPAKRDAVLQRYEEIKPKAERYSRYKWGSNSNGIALGFSPQFQSQVQEQLGSNLKTAIDIGLRFGSFSFGYKRGKDSLGKFKVPTTNSENSPYTVVPAGGVHIMESIYFQKNFELGSDTDTNSVVWGIPLDFAVIVNAVRTPDEVLYNNIAYGMGTGLRVDFYTKSTVSFDISALYHVGIPFSDIRKTDGLSPGIKNMNGETIAGSNTGAEIRIGMKFLFGATPPVEE